MLKLTWIVSFNLFLLLLVNDQIPAIDGASTRKRAIQSTPQRLLREPDEEVSLATTSTTTTTTTSTTSSISLGDDQDASASNIFARDPRTTFDLHPQGHPFDPFGPPPGHHFPELPSDPIGHSRRFPQFTSQTAPPSHHSQPTFHLPPADTGDNFYPKLPQVISVRPSNGPSSHQSITWNPPANRHQPSDFNNHDPRFAPAHHFQSLPPMNMPPDEDRATRIATLPQSHHQPATFSIPAPRETHRPTTPSDFNLQTQPEVRFTQPPPNEQPNSFNDGRSARVIERPPQPAAAPPNAIASSPPKAAASSPAGESSGSAGQNPKKKDDVVVYYYYYYDDDKNSTTVKAANGSIISSSPSASTGSAPSANSNLEEIPSLEAYDAEIPKSNGNSRGRGESSLPSTVQQPPRDQRHRNTASSLPPTTSTTPSLSRSPSSHHRPSHNEPSGSNNNDKLSFVDSRSFVTPSPQVPPQRTRSSTEVSVRASVSSGSDSSSLNYPSNGLPVSNVFRYGTSVTGGSSAAVGAHRHRHHQAPFDPFRVGTNLGVSIPGSPAVVHHHSRSPSSSSSFSSHHFPSAPGVHVQQQPPPPSSSSSSTFRQAPPTSLHSSSFPPPSLSSSSIPNSRFNQHHHQNNANTRTTTSLNGNNNFFSPSSSSSFSSSSSSSLAPSLGSSVTPPAFDFNSPRVNHEFSDHHNINNNNNFQATRIESSHNNRNVNNDPRPRKEENEPVINLQRGNIIRTQDGFHHSNRIDAQPAAGQPGHQQNPPSTSSFSFESPSTFTSHNNNLLPTTNSLPSSPETPNPTTPTPITTTIAVTTTTPSPATSPVTESSTTPEGDSTGRRNPFGSRRNRFSSARGRDNVLTRTRNNLPSTTSRTTTSTSTSTTTRRPTTTRSSFPVRSRSRPTRPAYTGRRNNNDDTVSSTTPSSSSNGVTSSTTSTTTSSPRSRFGVTTRRTSSFTRAPSVSSTTAAPSPLANRPSIRRPILTPGAGRGVRTRPDFSNRRRKEEAENKLSAEESAKEKEDKEKESANNKEGDEGVNSSTTPAESSRTPSKADESEDEGGEESNSDSSSTPSSTTAQPATSSTTEKNLFNRQRPRNSLFGNRPRPSGFGRRNTGNSDS